MQVRFSSHVNLFPTVDGNGVKTTCSCVDFLSVDMKGKVIVSASLPTYTQKSVQVRTYKTSDRLQVGEVLVTEFVLM